MKDFIRLNDSGVISMHIARGLSLSPLGIEIDCGGRPLTLRDARNIACDGSSLTLSFDALRAVLRVERAWDGAVFYSVDVENRSADDLRLRGISLQLFDGDWGACGPLCVSRDTLAYTYPAERAYGFDGPQVIVNNRPLDSCWFVSLHDAASQRGIAAGVFDAPTAFTRFRLVPLQSHSAGKRVLRLRCDLDTLSGRDGVRIPRDDVFSSRRLFLSIWDGPHDEGMDRVGERLAAQHRREPLPALPNGWCSWYAGYEQNISEAEVRKNLAVACTIEGMNIIQIDDGWTDATGTRTMGSIGVDRKKFPNGMRALADEIRAAGKTPGLWLRPFEGWGSDPEAPAWARGDCLDLSHPDCLEWLRGLVRTVTVDWGYAYLKLDFLSYDLFGTWGMELLQPCAARIEPRDDTLTNVVMLRRALETIRIAAGPTVYLLGCNSLLGVSMGVVDGFRIGDDVSAWNWDRTVTMGMAPVPLLRFLHGRVWHNDADCMLFHEPMTFDHVREWNGFVSANGLVAMVSSKLHELSPERRAELARVFPVRMETPSPAPEVKRSSPRKQLPRRGV